MEIAVAMKGKKKKANKGLKTEGKDERLSN